MRIYQTLMVILAGLVSMTVMGATISDKQVAQSVKVKWRKINVQNNVTLRHESQGLHKPAPDVSEQLSLDCDIEILDPQTESDSRLVPFPLASSRQTATPSTGYQMLFS